MKTLRLQLLSLTLLMLPLMLHAQIPGFERAGGSKKEQVHAELVADTEAIQSGVPFRAGVLFKIEPQWHTYWRYTGEIGLPTEITWKLPEGFEAGKLQWPNPVRFDDEGETSYGYEKSVLLFATITPPENLEAANAVTLGAEVSWLVCKVDGQCIPGSTELALELARGDAKPSPSAPIFDQWNAQVPVRIDAATSTPLPIRTVIEPATASGAAGGEVAQTVRFEAIEPWLLLSGEGDIAASLFPDFATGVEIAHPSLAEGLQPKSVHNKSAFAALSFKWPIKLAADAPAGQLALEAAATLPVINSATGETKFFHVAIPRQVEVTGGTNAAKAQSVSSATPVAMAPPVEATSLASNSGRVFSFLKDEPDPGSQRSVLMLLLFAFLGGILLNVMPCVLPVLSIKILSFVRQAGEDRRRIFRLGLAFAAGVFVSFLVLAILVIAIQGAGNQLGWGFQFQEPRFTVLMCAVIFAFGLSLFGVYEIELPGSAVQGASGLQRREGPVGAFFNGVLATALATPCTAPLLGPALGFAFAQPAAMILLFFLTIAAGLAMPYVLLSAFPGWLKFVPKAGPWMDTFKQSMGFLLMATVVWLLWVLNRQAGGDGVVWTLAFLSAVAFCCWLAGSGFDLEASPARKVVTVTIILMVLVGSYIYFPETYLRSLSSQGSIQTTVEAADMQGEIEWKPFSIQAVEKLAAENKTIFVDFTADWCLTCKVNENTVLARAEVQKAFIDYDVETLKADYTRQPPEMTRVLREFGRSGVPMYLIFPAGRPWEVVVLPEVLTPGLVVNSLKNAGKSKSIASEK